LSDFGIGWASPLAAFLASLVEAVEAFTIILAVGLFQGWRPALLGSFAGLTVLAGIVLALGPLIGFFPIHVLQLLIGVLLLLFGLRWLRKAILRGAGVIPLHDEVVAFERETGALRNETDKNNSQLDWIAGLTVFKAVLLEGIEVVFIVIAVSASQASLWPASIGALTACAIVILIGFAVRKPLSRVPENTLKFGVGAMLSAFGVFWTGEGLGVAWPGGDFAVLGFVALFVITGLALIALMSRAMGVQSR
jgi:Ca2+/H+ antiporter, TMEM165/GDT1 family